jgi:hypothetical protein
MIIDENDTIINQGAGKTGFIQRSELDQVILLSDGDQKCMYCNSTLKCGLTECIWREQFA